MEENFGKPLLDKNELNNGVVFVVVLVLVSQLAVRR